MESGGGKAPPPISPYAPSRAPRWPNASCARRANDSPACVPGAPFSAYFFFSSATERIGVPSARVSGKVTECEYHPGIEAE
jgi:hypothetical protein